MIERVDAERCIGCTVCVRVCPLDVLRMDRDPQGRPVARIAYREDCQTCFLCEEYCPVDAIYVASDRGALHAVWPWPEEPATRAAAPPAGSRASARGPGR